MKNLLLLLLFAPFSPLRAIDFYQPGDTLYVWATSGLVLRKAPSPDGAKLKTVPYGTLLVALNYSGDKQTEVEAVPGFTAKGEKYPPVMLRGGFAMVAFRGDTGYVFDGYLSKLPSLLRFPSVRPDGPPVFESLEEWGKRNFGIVSEIKRGKFLYGFPSSAKKVFGNGIVADVWTEKESEGRTILPDISMEEAFLLFSYSEHYEWDIRHIPQETEEDSWGFGKVSDHEWTFGNGSCGYKILFLPAEKMTVTTTHCTE